MPDHPPDPHNTADRLDWSQPKPSNGAIDHGAGLTVRAYTAEELRARLDPPAPAEPALPASPAAPPTPAPAAPPIAAGAPRPGASARAEYRHRRAVELTRWTRGLPWRLTLAATAALVATMLAGGLALPRSWLAGLLATAGTAWTLRFQPTQPTRAWRDGARGERATARRLRRLERDGYTVLHDLAIPGSRANIDHVVIGPSGVFVVDSKCYRGRLHQTPDGMLWHGRYPLAQAVATLWWEARMVGDALAAGPQVPITPLLVIHRAAVPWGGLMVAGILVIGPDALAEALSHEPVLPNEEVAWLAQRVTAWLAPAALKMSRSAGEASDW
jgi:hypothetical protein